MSFQCVECGASGFLNITARMELPSDSRSDDITLQVIKCGRCGFAGLSVYEESRRGALDSESFDHTGYHVNAADVEAVEKLIKKCPKPRDPRCGCWSHRKLGKKDASARWSGLRDIKLEKAFPLRISR